MKWTRGCTEKETAEDMIRDVTFFDLIASLKFAMDRIPKRMFHEIVKINVTVEEQIAFLEELFSHRSEATFFEIVKDFTERIRIVVTFLALLEVIRSKNYCPAAFPCTVNCRLCAIFSKL